jgi:hypothetical protein
MRISSLVDAARNGAGAPTQCAGASACTGTEARRQRTFEAKSAANCAKRFIGGIRKAMTIPLLGASIFPTRNAIRQPFKRELCRVKKFDSREGICCLAHIFN